MTPPDKKYYLDLHTHTTMFSSCSDMEPEELVDRAIELGLDGVAITEHDRRWPPKLLANIREYARSKGELIVLNGQEVRSREGCDFLVFGAHDTIECYKYSSLELAEMLFQNGIPVIGAHPLREGFSFGDDLYKIGFTALEVFNNRDGRDEEKLLALIKRKKISTIGGSDSHDWEKVGRLVTEFDSPIENEERLVETLFTGSYRAVRRSSFSQR